ncbi:molybdopterin-guanine dinucleotide biosynthesis protein B [Neobacillus drentensis]|uniref:molybdopterin-guanine dinucleotide biosynthesis protein B n=1 Tax=Neobacillus drentensis TaxID=220684 RepID=UPI003000948A
MALVRPAIFQVVGYQNSGKTTLTTKLINVLTETQIKTVTIKHHGHGGKPENIPLKDTEKHLMAGALAAIVEGEGKLLLKAENNDYTLHDQIELMKFFQPDVILIEGYKREPFPKLLLLRNENDLSLLNMVSNVKAIVYWKEELHKHLALETDVPCFHIDDNKLIFWIIELLRELVHKID